MKGQLIGYGRVSSLDQDTTIQLEQLEAVCDGEIFHEKVSGTSKAGRTALEACFKHLRKGDTLVITRIDRLARSARDLHNIVHDLEERDISLRVLEQNIDTSTSAGKAFLGMLFTFAEFETNIRKERQMDGVKKAKDAGKYTGRKPTALAKKPQMIELLASGMSKPKIAKEVGVSVASVYNILSD